MPRFDAQQRAAATARRGREVAAGAATVTSSQTPERVLALKLGVADTTCTRAGCGHDQQGHTHRWGPDGNQTAAVQNCRLCSCAVFAPAEPPAGPGQ